MVRGLPDDANVMGYGDMQRSDDITELAARLGSPLTYERRGNVLYSETFKHGASTWNVLRASVAENATLTGSYHITDGAGLLLETTLDTAQIVSGKRDLPLFSEGFYGLFIVASMRADTKYFQLAAEYYDGTKVWDYSIRLSSMYETLGYKGSAGAFVELTDELNFFSGRDNFHAIGIVFDTVTDEYTEITLDGVTYDMSDITTQGVINATAPLVRVDMWVESDSLNQATAVVDSVVLVQNPTVVN